MHDLGGPRRGMWRETGRSLTVYKIYHHAHPTARTRHLVFYQVIRHHQRRDFSSAEIRKHQLRLSGVNMSSGFWSFSCLQVLAGGPTLPSLVGSKRRVGKTTLSSAAWCVGGGLGPACGLWHRILHAPCAEVASKKCGCYRSTIWKRQISHTTTCWLTREREGSYARQQLSVRGGASTHVRTR